MFDSTSTRTCGGCTACCKVMDIVEMDKEHGDWCPQCVIGTGCAMYQDRPKVCHEFSCDWLLGFHQLSDEKRPDRAKVMFRTGTFSHVGRALQVYEISKKSWTRRAVREVVAETIGKALATENMAVMFIFLSGDCRVYLPEGKSPPKILENQKGIEFRKISELVK